MQNNYKFGDILTDGVYYYRFLRYDGDELELQELRTSKKGKKVIAVFGTARTKKGKFTNLRLWGE